MIKMEQGNSDINDNNDYLGFPVTHFYEAASTGHMTYEMNSSYTPDVIIEINVTGI